MGVYELIVRIGRCGTIDGSTEAHRHATAWQDLSSLRHYPKVLDSSQRASALILGLRARQVLWKTWPRMVVWSYFSFRIHISEGHWATVTTTAEAFLHTAEAMEGAPQESMTFALDVVARKA